jgi:hypothetical protein
MAPYGVIEKQIQSVIYAVAVSGTLMLLLYSNYLPTSFSFHCTYQINLSHGPLLTNSSLPSWTLFFRASLDQASTGL